MVDQRALKVMTVGDLLVRYRYTITPAKRGAGMERYKVDAFLSHPISRRDVIFWSAKQLSGASAWYPIRYWVQALR